MWCLWSQTLEDADTYTSRWQWQPMSTWSIQDSRLYRLTTQATTHRSWRAPKNKRSELKISDKIKRCFENTLPWMEPWKSKLSRRCTSLPIPTGGSTHRFRTGVWANHAAASICQLQCEQLNWPQGKCSQDDETIWPLWTPSPTNQTVRKRVIICKIRTSENLRSYDDVKRNRPDGTNGNF